MSDVAISVENISKCYRIGTQGGPAYHRLSEMITGVPQALWNAGKSRVRKSSIAAGAVPDVQNTGEFWALKDVSFEIKQGEVVGIIGRNGAGKSTLLKILSRITEPTSGRFGVSGRVASLLEVGTGFHPELTGRENIYVSGTTLGMTRTEIKKQFDEIVDFSGVEGFLDTPVKHYSSGMQVRLGFAVAAHLESEILIVDEVLAVGDAEFQKKCVGKMRHVTQRQNTTVLLVSHNSAMLETLCSTAVMIKGGTVFATGTCDHVMQAYRGEQQSETPLPLAEQRNRQGNGLARFLSIRLSTNAWTNVDSVKCGDQISLLLEVRLKIPANVEISVGINDELDRRIAHVSTNLFKTGAIGLETGIHTIAVDFPRLALAPGIYWTTLFMVADGQIADWVKDGGLIRVTHGPFFQSGRLPPEGQGYVLLDHSFRVLDELIDANPTVESQLPC
jgi:lipopolysaccharide transport system ATP-binding protein